MNYNARYSAFIPFTKAYSTMAKERLRQVDQKLATIYNQKAIQFCGLDDIGELPVQSYSTMSDQPAQLVAPKQVSTPIEQPTCKENNLCEDLEAEKQHAFSELFQKNGSTLTIPSKENCEEAASEHQDEDSQNKMEYESNDNGNEIFTTKDTLSYE